jgi:ferritin-like protein
MKVIKESYEVSDELAKRLNSILADEFLATEAYRLAIVAMKGNKQHRLEEIAEKNGEDELEDHFKNLSDWMQSKGITVVTDTDEMKEITNGTILKFKDGMSTTEIVDQLILSEEEAIAVYEDTIPHTELDLNTMLCGFLKDEREHLKELVDCRDEMGGGDKASEPKHKIYEDRTPRHKVEPNYEVYKAVDIDWDVDDEEDLADLPAEVEVEVPRDVIFAGEDAVEEYVSDAITDETGFCHNGFYLK